MAGNGMRLAAVRVFVSDIAGAVDFYRDQLGLQPEAVSLDDGYAVFPLANGADLIVEADAPEEDGEEGLVGRFVGASLAVDDIEEAYQSLSEQGVRFADPPERQPWGGWLAHFMDPDDNVLSLVQLPEADPAV
ncbi:MAG: VOC family protein [Alphaproteobacteria bacterium]